MDENPLPPVGETKTVKTRDGRDLAYVDFGDPSWPLVIHNHGGPSSRLEARMLAGGATKHRLRLVSVDRPGIGRSTPQSGRTCQGWADDLTHVADALGYERFGVSGWSEGGPWPLGVAAYIDPTRLRHVTSIAGGDYGAFGDNWAASYLDAADALGPDGLIADSVLLYRSWQFDVTKIERRVHIWQGTDDRLVPLPINKQVADRTPGAVWHEVEGAGHFVAVGEADRIFAIAADELGA